MARFPYSSVGTDAGILMPRLPMVFGYGSRSIEVEGLVDTGAAINVLPFRFGLALGMNWEEQRVALTLTGALANYDARAVFVSATNSLITGPTPVELAVAWTRSEDVAVIFGQTNFFMEFNACFYRSEGVFDAWRK